MLKARIHLSGRVRLELRGSDGAVKAVRDVDNLVVDSGKTHVAQLLESIATAQMSHIAIGGDGTGLAAGNTALGSELSRKTMNLSFPKNSPSNQAAYEATFLAGSGTGNIKEVGIFNAGAGGTMLCRAVFDGMNKDADDELTVAWQVVPAA